MPGGRGIQRERAVKAVLLAEDWWVCRAAGSIGDADLVALKDGHRPRLVEVKSTAGGPFEHFRPADRADLLFAARLAGAQAVLAWWPPRGRLHWLFPEDWPATPERVSPVTPYVEGTA